MSEVTECQRQTHWSMVTTMHVMEASVRVDLDFELGVIFVEYAVAIRGRLVLFIDVDQL